MNEGVSSPAPFPYETGLTTVAVREPSARLQVIRPPSFSFHTLGSGFLSLIEYSDLLLTLTRHRLDVRYRQSVLGWIWALAQPLALMLIYTGIFSLLAHMPSQGVPYPVFAL
jgi:lipopolysaccharide transport system permease protein